MNKLAQSAGRINALLQRVLNAMVLCIIALAVFAQCLVVLMALEGWSPGGVVASVLELVRPAILPGLLFAFLKFLLHAIRSFKSGPARFKALLYLLITTSPLTLGLSAAYLSQGARTSVAGDRAPEGEQFLLGRDWARARQPVRNGECSGTSEFVRGCRFAVKERQDAELQAGYEWARQHRPAKASACQGRPYFVLGCRRYFLEHLQIPKPAGQGKYEGMTTEECKVEVNANFEAADRLDIENGNYHAPAVRLRRSWLPELQDCENYDRHAKQAAQAEPPESPYERLTRLVMKLKAHEALTEEEKAAVEEDTTEMSTREASGFKRAYFRLHDEYAARLSGEYRPEAQAHPLMSCEAFAQKLAEMRRLEKERVAAISALRRDDGVIMNSALHDELHRQRLDMLWDWKHYTDGAKAAGCDIKAD